MPFLLSNWKLVLIGALSLLLTLTFKLWRDEVRAFDIYRAEVKTLGEHAQREKARLEKDHNQLVKELTDAWPKNLDAARANAVAAYAARLRNPDPGSGGLSRAPARAEAPDVPGEERMAACPPGFIEDAAEDALRITEWQAWASGMRLPLR